MKIPFFKKKEKKKLSRTISGSRHKTIFHGGCIGCENDDLSICQECCYFEAD